MNLKIATVMAIAALGTVKASAQHNTDLWPGQSGGRVAWSPAGLIPGSVYHPLGRVDTFLHGWSANNPGFDRTFVSVGGVSPLPASSQIWLRVVALDPALFVVDNAFNVLEFPGDMTYLGSGTNLHIHVTWFIDETDPAFDPEQCVWEATFVLDDMGSGLADSLPFTLFFSNVPVRGGEFPPQNTPANGDFDDDRDVDGLDAAAFVECMNGPQRRPSPDDPDITLCEVNCFNAFDFEDDMDIDLLDFAEFQVEYEP